MWNFITNYILPVLLVILVMMAIIIIGIFIYEIINQGIYTTRITIKSDYIQNIETKLNIYEQSYDNFVLEDSLRQVE